MGRVPIKLVVLIVGVIAAVAIPVAVTVRRSNRAVAEWKAVLALDQVRGKTARELVERFGEPKSLERDRPTGMALNMVFEGPDGNYCQIDFENDRAARVNFWSR